MNVPTFLKKLWPSSLRSQLIIGIAFILVVLMSLLVWQLMNRQKNFFLKLNHDRAHVLSENLSGSATSYVNSNELVGLQKLVSTYKNIPDIEYAIVASNDGVVLAHTDTKYIGLIFTDSISKKLKPINVSQTLIENNTMLDIATPIMNNGEIIGWARVGLSQEYIEPNLKEIRRSGLLFILISLIVGSIFAIIVSAGLTTGLGKLVSAAKKIKAGNRNFRVGSSNSSEIAELGTAFNEMLDKLSANDKLLTMVLNNMPVGVWILDEKGNIISANPAGEAMWKGIKYVGADDYTVYKAWFTDTGKEVQTHEWGASIVLGEGRPVLDQEMEIECFDKTHKIILNSAIPLRDETEKIIGVITINVDITERKRSEARIKERESQLTTLFENIDGATSLLDIEKKYILFNQRFIDDHHILSGHDPYVGELVYDFLPTDLLENRHKMLDNVLKGNKEVIEAEHVRNGKRFYYRSSFSPVITNGKVTGISTFSIDLTKSKEAEIKVRESEEKFRLSFMTSQDAFYIGTLNEGRIIDINESFNELFGYTKEECIGKTSSELHLYIYPEERAKMVEGLKKSKSLKDLEMTCRKKSGELMIVSITVNLWEMNNEKVIMAVIRDITERKRIEKELIESDLRFREVLENSLSASFKRNLETNTYEYLSPVFTKITGFTPNEMNNLPLETVIGLMHPDDIQGVKDGITIAINKPSESANSLEYRFKHKTNGDYRWLQDNFVVMHNEQGQAVSFIGSVSDITERKKATELFRYQFENSPDIILIIDKDLKIESINRSRSNGPTVEELIGKNCIDVLPDESQESAKKAVLECFETGQSLEIENTLKDNRWVRSRFVPIRELGEITHIMIIATDITERKLAEESLRSSEEKNRALVENITDAIILLDESLKIIYRSPSVRKVTGFTNEEMLDKNVFDLIHPDDLQKSRSFFQKIYNSPGIPMQDQIRLKHKFGHYIWVEGVLTNMLHNPSIKAIVATYRDITERKNFEEQQMLISSIVNSSDDAIISKTLDGTITSWNKGAEKVLGYTFEEAIGRNISLIVPPLLSSEEELISRNISRGIAIQHFETQRKRKDDIHIDVSLTISPISDSTGKIIGASKILRNITERKTAEIVLKDSEEKRRLIINGALDAIVSIDDQGRVTSWNPQAETIFGWSEKEILNKFLSETIIPVQHREAHKKGMKHYFSTGKHKVLNKLIELTAINKRNEEFPIELNIVPIVQGESTFFTAFIRDISARKKAVSELKESEEKFRSLVEETPVGVFILQDEKIIYVNPGFAEICGYSEKELLDGMTFQQLIYEEDVSWVEENHKLRISGKVPSDEYILRALRKDGKIIFVDIIVSRIIYNNKPAVIGSVIDKTSQVEEEKRIGRAVTDAQERERLQIGMELHDNVKQLMAASIMSLDFAKNKIDEKERSIEIIDNVKGYIMEAIDELRRLSHQLAPAVDTNTGSLIEKIEKLVNDTKISDKMEMLVDVDEFDKPISTEIQLAFYRIMQEQFTNILKYSKASCVLLKIKKRDEQLTMTIIDDGIGFNVLSKKDGIGLENIKRRINMLNGHSEIISSPGEGCEVRVSVQFG